MKTGKIIFALYGAMLGAYIAPGYALNTWIDCIDCTDERTGECTMYGATCCEPCKNGGGTIRPIECDSATCNGDTYENTSDNCTTVKTKGCQNSICTTVTTTDKCNKGYWGTPNALTCSNATGCSACPLSDTGVAGTTDGYGATQMADCYLPSGASGSDATGSVVYTDKCPY